MMKHGKIVEKEVRNQVSTNLSKWGVLSLATVVVLREEAEIVPFAFASVNQQSYVIGLFAGIGGAVVLAYFIFLSLVRVNLSIIFNITLVYLVLQAGYLFGYSVHEFLSAMKASDDLASDNVLFSKVYNLQNTLLDHKSGAIGIPLNVLFGWYSRPEWIQFILHYSYIIVIFLLWGKLRSKRTEAVENSHKTLPVKRS